MNKKFRYGLIIAGFVIFGLVAPLIVMFVSGKTFNWKTKKLVSTGIIAFKIEPKDANISLNNLAVEIGDAELKQIRFLTGGEYKLTIKKPDYFPWQKSLYLEAGKVFWVKDENKKIILLKTNQTIPARLQDVSEVVSDGKTIAVLAKNQLEVWHQNNTTTPEQYLLPQKTNQIIYTKDFHFLLTADDLPIKQTAYLIDQKTKKVIDLQKHLKNLNLSDFQFAEDNRLLALGELGFYEYSQANNQFKLLVQKAKAFTTLENLAYLIVESENTLALETLDLDSLKTQSLLANLPKLYQPQLAVNNQKNIFIIDRTSLYQVSTLGLQTLTQNLGDLNIKTGQDTNSWLDSGELKFQTQGNPPVSITRASETLKTPIILPDLDYALFHNQKTITALEINPEGGQNRYNLYSGTEIKKMGLVQNNTLLWILDQDQLKFLTIR